MKSLLSAFKVDRDNPACVREQIERFLTGAIRSGRLKVNDPFPTTQELAGTWGVNISSLQKAMTSLRARGLIERKRKAGTFVRSLTEQVEIAVLVGPDLLLESAYYHRALAQSLQTEIEARKWRCSVHGHLNRLWSGGEGVRAIRRELRDAIDKNGICGLALVAMGEKGAKDVGLKTILPLVRCSQVQRYSDVMHDYYRFARDTIEWVAARGRTNVACLGFVEKSDAFQGVLDASRAGGLPEPAVEPLYCVNHPEGATEEEGCRRTLALAAEWKRSRRCPDALIVSDDVAMRGVALALLQAGVRVPDELLVVALANEGVNFHYGIPVVRYEFSIRDAAREALAILWKRMLGDEPSGLPAMLGGRIRAPADVDAVAPKRAAVTALSGGVAK